MIQQVSFTNFKSLRRVDAGLERFTVIVGPNGSGKTSILDGLRYLAQTTRWPLATLMNGAPRRSCRSRRLRNGSFRRSSGFARVAPRYRGRNTKASPLTATKRPSAPWIASTGASSSCSISRALRTSRRHSRARVPCSLSAC
ncbi:AAA family ATPase [Sorangium sp. So ce1389]|uniref:AAA family ATPase n=1 Tax=Sorangium sp. So ce1389 TaxID=3133336 RepID=UPI003F62FB9D